MQLDKYLRQNEISVPAFQARIGVRSRNTVYRYLRGDQIPKREIMRRIVEATGGQVTPSDFFAPALDEAAA